MSNDVTTVNTALPAGLQAIAQQYAPNAGMETVKATDLKLPFYRILQPGSKEVLAGTEKYRQEARPGQIIEGAISNAILEQLNIVPIKIVKGYAEFIPQKQGGGFAGWHSEETAPLDQAVEVEGKFHVYRLPNGNELTYTFQLFFLVDPVAKGSAQLGCMSFSGGNEAEIKKFLSYTMSLSHPLFLKAYPITTFPKFNKNHNSTTFRANFNVDKSEYVSEDIATAAAKLFDQLDDAQLKAMAAASVEAGAAGPDEVQDAVDASMD